MTNLDDLKDAMAAPPDFAPRPIDLGTVMVAGGRVRRRRRLAVSAASGLAVAALLVGGAQFASRAAAPELGGPAQVAGQGEDPQPTSAQPTSTQPPNTKDESPRPATTSMGGVLGDIIHTGVDGWLLYTTSIDDPALPDTHFGVNVGLAAPNGQPVTVVTTNETTGSDRSPGFHAVQGTMEVETHITPTFGYYIGSAVRITATANGTGRTVNAHRATWSEDPSVVMFWFNPDVGSVRNLKAYGSDGQRLPAGRNGIGVG